VQDQRGKWRCYPVRCHTIADEVAGLIQSADPGASWTETILCAGCGGTGCSGIVLELAVACNALAPRVKDPQQLPTAVAKSTSARLKRRSVIRWKHRIAVAKTIGGAATGISPLRRDGMVLWGPAPGRQIYPPGNRAFPEGYDPNLELRGNEGAWVKLG